MKIKRNIILSFVPVIFLIILFACSLDFSLKERDNPHDSAGTKYGGKLPVVTFTTPTNGQVLAPSFTVTGTAADDIGLTYVNLNINNGSFIAIPLKGTSTNWSYNFTSAPFGSNVIRAFTKDIGGNTSPVNTVTVFVDAYLPSIFINSPADGVITNSTAVLLSGTASVDPLFSISEVSVETNSNTWVLALRDSSGSWTCSAALTEGTNTFRVRAITSVSRTNASPYIIIIRDTTAPSVSLINLTNNQVFGDSFPFEGTVSDQYAGGSRVFVKPDDTLFGEVPVSNSSFSTNISLLAWEGFHTNYYYTIDALGNSSATNTLIVEFSMRMPMVYIASPYQYYITNSLTIPVSGSNTVGVFYTITSLQAKVNTGSWSNVDMKDYSQKYWTNTTVLTQDMTNTITIMTAASSGLTNSNSVIVICDTIQPVISLSSTLPAYTNLTSFNLGLNISDNLSGILSNTFQINSGTPTGFTAGGITVSGLTNGLNTVRIWTVDKALNTSLTQAVNIFVDTAAPSVSVAFPADGTVTNQPVLTLSGTFGDPAPSAGIKTFTVSLNGLNQTLTTNTSGVWAVSNAAFTANATNTIAAFIEDNAGNSLFLTNKTVVDTIAPAVASMSPTNGEKLATNFTVTADISDNFTGVKQIDLQIIQTNGIDFKTYSITPVASISTNVTMTNIADYYIWFRVIDYADNTNNTASNIIYIKDIPILHFTSPAANGSTIITNGLSVNLVGTTSTLFNAITNNFIILNDTQTNSASGTDAWNYTLTLSNNCTNEIRAYAINNNGDAGSVQLIKIVADTNAPVITSVSPSNCITNMGSFTFTMIESDNFSGIQSNFIKIDTSPWQAFSGTTYNTSLTDGYHTISNYTRDIAENCSLTDSIYITNDSVAPTITLTNPANGLIINAISLNIGGNTNDAFPSSGIRTFRVEVNGADAIASWNGSYGGFNPDVTNTISAYIEDNAGNNKTVTNIIIVDTVKPAAAFYPISYFTNISSFTVSASSTDNFSGIASNICIAIRVSPYSVKRQETNFVSLDFVSDGQYIYQIWAFDRAGNCSVTNIITNFIDTYAPVISLTAGIPLYTNVNSYIINFSISDNVPSSGTYTNYYKLDNNSDTGFAGTTFGLSGLTEGQHIVNIWTIDNAGNISSTNAITNTVDTAIGTLTVTNPSLATAVSLSQAYSFSGTHTEPNLAGIYVSTNGSTFQTVNISGNGWLTNLVLYYGSNNIRVYMRDLANNNTSTNNYIVYYATNVYVSAGGSDSTSGLITGSPALTINNALSLANTYGITNILIAAGIYTNGGGLAVVSSSNGITISNTYNKNITGGWNPGFSSITGVSEFSRTNGTVLSIMNCTNLFIANLVIRDCTNATGNGAGIYVNSANNITLSNIVSSNNSANNGGGIYFVYATNNSISGGYVSDNKASQNGAGMYLVNSPNNTISACIISNNQSLQGGGIFSTAAPYNIFTGCTICYNAVSSHAGGIYLYQGDDYNIITNCYIYKNTSPGNGGGIWVYGSTANYIKISGCNVYSNSAQLGGGIYLFTANYNVIFNNNIFNNTAADGGGIYFKTANNNTISACVISNNTATNGGGVFITNSGLNTISFCSIFGNTGSADGGGISFRNSSWNAISNCIISNNSSPEGAGIYFRDSPNNLISSNSICYNKNMGVYIYTGCNSNIVSNCSIFNNSHSNGNGGGILFSSSYNQLLSCNIYSNFASGQGGGVTVWNNSNTISNCVIYSNAALYGGGIYISANYNTVNSNSIYNNTATNGGGIYLTSANYNTIAASSIYGNTATANGGGIYFTSINNNTITNSRISNNSASWGGGLYFLASTYNTVSGSIINNNTASTHGGGIFISLNSSHNSISGSGIFNNTASNSGGGLAFYDNGNNNNIISGGSIYSNTALSYGGGICFFNICQYFTNTGLIVNNLAIVNGGGIYTSVIQTGASFGTVTNNFTNTRGGSGMTNDFN